MFYYSFLEDPDLKTLLINLTPNLNFSLRTKHTRFIQRHTLHTSDHPGGKHSCSSLSGNKYKAEDKRLHSYLLGTILILLLGVELGVRG